MPSNADLIAHLLESGYADARVADAMRKIDRANFIPPELAPHAYHDTPLPIAHGQTISAPGVVALMSKLLDVRAGMTVLEVGTGSGYMTALLASLGSHVYSVDIVPEFIQSAGARLAAHGVTNTTLETGDAARGWDRHAPYDAIVVTGSMPVLPDAFPKSLRPGGRLIAVVGEPPVMVAQLITCIAAGAYSTTGLFETCIAPLKNAVQPERFVF